jgi:osmotically-inducible protein OsmY
VRINKHLNATLLVLCFLFICAAAPAGRPDDKTITPWVEETLRQDPRIDSSRIRVATDAGIVHLTGQVPDLASKNYAGLEAQKISGVKGVINEIIVFAPYQSDTDIEQNLKRGFLSSADIPLRSVKVKVKDGQVSLSGQVESFAEKKEAELIATELRGVRSVDNKLVVANRLTRSDGQIRQDVIDALGRDVYLLNLLIDAQVHNGVVTLTGNVDTPYQKERAAEDSLSVANVEEVKNYLTIGIPEAVEVHQKAPMPTDSALEKSVRAELYQDLRVMDPFGIDVKAVSGQVTLSGTVPSYYQKRLAGRDAYEVVGVVKVTNLISVDTVWREDDKIRDDIKFALDTDTILSGLDIQVRVKNGTVTLDGNVNTLHEKEEAAEAASRILGVRDVINDIHINKYHKYSDAALKEHIEKRFASDWETHRAADHIRITVNKGIVTLSGDVNTWSEYREAAEVASLTDGVWELINRLRVTGVNYPWNKD